MELNTYCYALPFPHASDYNEFCIWLISVLYIHVIQMLCLINTQLGDTHILLFTNIVYL